MGIMRILFYAWMFQHDYLDTYCLSVLYACILHFCICTCSAQLSMFHVERRSRNTLIIFIIIKMQVIEPMMEKDSVNKAQRTAEGQSRNCPGKGNHELSS